MGKTGFATDEAKKKGNKQTNNGLIPSLHKLFRISKLINVVTKLAYFKQQLRKKAEKQAPQTFTLLEYMTKGDFESQGKS